MAAVDVSPEQRDMLAGLGLLQVLQRSPASAAEKAMAGYDKRPAGFKRDSIPFNDDNALTLQGELEKPIEIGEGIDKLTCEIAVSEYVPTEGNVKMTEERDAYARRTDDAGRKALAKLVSYSGELGDGTKENAPVEFIRAIRRYSQSIVKGL